LNKNQKTLLSEKRRYALLMVLIGLLMGSLYWWMCPSLSDDIPYRFVFHADEGAPVEPLQQVSDVVRSQVVHWQTVNGRTTIESLAQLWFLLFDDRLLGVVNAVLFVVLLHLCNVLLSGEIGQRYSLWRVTAVFFLLFIVIKGLASALLWNLGSFNYLWVLVMVTAVVAGLRRWGERKFSWLQAWLWPLAFLAGWTHEGLTLPVSIAFVAYLVVHRKSIFRQAAAPVMICFCLGMLMCLVSPNLRGRADGDGLSVVQRLFYGAINIATNVRIGWLLAVAVGWSWWKRRAVLVDELRRRAYGYLAFVMALGIVVLCGVTLERVAFFADFIALLLLLSLVGRLQAGRGVKRWSMGVMWGVILAVFPFAWSYGRENYEHYEHIRQQLYEPGKELIAVRQMDDCALAQRYVFPCAEFGFYSCYQAFDSTDLNMRCAAALCGKKKVVFLPEDVIEKASADSSAYRDYALDAHGKLFIWRLSDERPVERVVFHLKDEKPDTLPLRQRLLVYPDSTYALDAFRFEAVTIAGRRYLVFTRPVTNIFRRIKGVEF